MATHEIIQYSDVHDLTRASNNCTNGHRSKSEERPSTSSPKHLNISAELLQNVLYGKLTSTSAMKLYPSFPGR